VSKRNESEISAMTWSEYLEYRARWLAENETPETARSWMDLLP
jgi:hypothetical protein